MSLASVDIHQTTLGQQVTETIRSAILRGHLRSGSRLRQAVIADQLGVSQATVREALLALEQEGLVSGVPYAGYHVNRLSGRDVRELFEMRALLETYALEHPDEAVRASVIERLEASIKGMSEASKNGDQEGFIAGDVAFHRAVVSLASNSLVESLWVLMTPRVRLFMSGEDQLADDLCAVADSHWTIVEAMKVKDFKKAQTALREHLHLCSKVLGTDGAARDSD